MGAPPNPLNVECPRCGNDVGEPCLKPSGELAPAPHKARVKLAEQEAAAATARAEGDAQARIEDLEPRWQRVYVACRLELEQRAAWTRLAAAELEAMARNMAAASKARAGAVDDPLVLGSQGQKVANPLHAIALRYEQQALAIAKALKLTPDTRGTSVEVPDDGAVDDAADAAAGELDDLADLDKVASLERHRATRKRKRG